MDVALQEEGDERGSVCAMCMKTSQRSLDTHLQTDSVVAGRQVLHFKVTFTSLVPRLALFPGPAQLSVACSTAMESWAGPGNEAIPRPY